MANYWVQNPAQNEVWVKLNRRDVDYYQAAVEFITEQAHVPDKPYYDNIVLSVAPAENAKLNEYGFSLANYLFHEDENDNTIVYKGLPPILFTVDWFADCMNGTLDEMANTREAAGQDGIDHKEEMKSYGPYIKALGMDPSILTVDALTIKDISEEIVDKNVFAWKDDARRKWEELAKFGAIEKLYGARGWDIAILSITFDIATELVRRKQPKKNIWGIEDQPDLWKSIVTAAREKAVQLLNTPDIAALRSGSMSPEDYTRMYLEETERHEKPQRPSFSRLVRDDPFMKHDPDDKRPWMVKGDE